MKSFESPTPSVDVLVCSDVLASGLNIASLDVVINYDVPSTLRSYVNRVARTARAGRSGATFTIVTQREEPTSSWDLISRHAIPKESLRPCGSRKIQ